MDRDFQEHTEQACIASEISPFKCQMVNDKGIHLLDRTSSLSEQVVLDDLMAGQATVLRLTMWYDQARTYVIDTITEPHFIWFKIKCVDMVYSEGTVTFRTSMRPRKENDVA